MRNEEIAALNVEPTFIQCDGPQCAKQVRELMAGLTWFCSSRCAAAERAERYSVKSKPLTYNINLDRCVSPACSRAAMKKGGLCKKCLKILDSQTTKECETADCSQLMNYYDMYDSCCKCRSNDPPKLKQCETETVYGKRCARTLGHTGEHTLEPGPVTPKFLK